MLIRLLKTILRHSKFVLNNKGIIPALITAGVGYGLQQLGKSKRKDPEMEWYVDPWTQKLRDIAQPRLDPSFYRTPATGVETATKEALIPRLGRGVSDIKPTLGPEAATKYYEAEKLKRGERFGEEQTFLKDILQKEGVLTSTPGITAQTKLKRQQQAELGAFSEKLMYEDIERDIQATQMAENIIASTLTQGMALGGQQRQTLQWPYVMSQAAMGQAQGLGSAGYMPQAGTNWMEDLGGAGMDIGKLMLLTDLLKSTGTKTKKETKEEA